MSYVINSKLLQGDTIVTNVTFSLSNNVTTTVDVAHFRPASLLEIYNNIENREATEELNITSTAAARILFDQIEL